MDNITTIAKLYTPEKIKKAMAANSEKAKPKTRKATPKPKAE